jgi:hypothetical protein
MAEERKQGSAEDSVEEAQRDLELTDEEADGVHGGHILETTVVWYGKMDPPATKYNDITLKRG